MSGDDSRGELLESWPPSPAVLDAWRALAVGRENVFITPEWFEAWIHAGSGEDPFAIVCRRNEELIGVVTLVLGRRGRARALRFAGAGPGDWFGPATRPEDEDAVATACMGALEAVRRRWHVIELDRLESSSGWAASLRGAWPGRAPGLLDLSRRAVYPNIELGEGGVDEWLAGKPQRVRADLRRGLRRLSNRPGTRFRMTLGEDDLDRDLDTLFRLHAARWGDRSSALVADRREFHRRLALASLRRGWLRLWLLEVDGEPVAANYGWRLGSRYLSYSSGYDPARRDLGPGMALMLHTIERAAEEGVATFDLMRGDSEYKRRLETGRREARSLLITRPMSPRAATIGAMTRATTAARSLPPGLREPAGRAYRVLVRR